MGRTDRVWYEFRCSGAALSRAQPRECCARLFAWRLPYLFRRPPASLVPARLLRLTDRPMYTELHARSAFSFLEGASAPEELTPACKELGLPAMAVLDRDGVYGAPRFHLSAEKMELR